MPLLTRSFLRTGQYLVALGPHRIVLKAAMIRHGQHHLIRQVDQVRRELESARHLTREVQAPVQGSECSSDEAAQHVTLGMNNAHTLGCSA